MANSGIILTAALVAAVVAWTPSAYTTLRRFLHLLQLEDYEVSRMLRLAARHPGVLAPVGLDLAGALLIVAGTVGVAFLASHRPPAWAGHLGLAIPVGGMLWVVGCLTYARRLRQTFRGSKKPLVWTPRSRRIFAASILVGLLATGSLLAAAGAGWSVWAVPAFYLSQRLSPLWLAAAVALLAPAESAVQGRYLHQARTILEKHRLLTIGITGSYGKTGTKELLAALLANRYNVLKPPGSHNTLMAVTRLIREQLRPYHEVMIVEMGAYRLGSIARLCDLVQPTHGIITAIGVQHLERFKSQDVIQQAKSELVKTLPESGTAVLNGGDPRCRAVAETLRCEVRFFRVWNDPTESPWELPYPALTVSDVTLTLDGSDFQVTYPDGNVQRVHLSLLGRGAVANAAAAICLADHLGVSRDDIARTLAAMPQVKHRLEVIRREGITIIDDAYNSNPVGAAGALEVLGLARSGRRILITPGMVELGQIESETNRAFGRMAAPVCDLAVLIGQRRTEPIRQGLLEGGLTPDRIWVCPTLAAGWERLQSFLAPGDTILLENDLPDQYYL